MDYSLQKHVHLGERQQRTNYLQFNHQLLRVPAYLLHSSIACVSIYRRLYGNFRTAIQLALASSLAHPQHKGVYTIPNRLATLATLLLMGRGVDPEKNRLFKAASDTLGELGNLNTITELNHRSNDYELLSFKHIQFNSAISSKGPSTFPLGVCTFRPMVKKLSTH